MGVQKQTALHGLLVKQTNYFGRGLQDQSQAKLCQGTEFSVASPSGPGGKQGKGVLSNEMSGGLRRKPD